MKIILRTDVEKVGRAGDVKEVSAGFGRNYLIPRKLAMLATPAALKFWEKGQLSGPSSARSARRGLEQREVAGVALSFFAARGCRGQDFRLGGQDDILRAQGRYRGQGSGGAQLRADRRAQ
jgi:large subunit ribosomal protein L9